MTPNTAPNTPANADDWAEIRRWRKAMRERLTAQRLAITADARSAHHHAVTALLRAELAAHPEGPIGCYWPFKGEFDPRPLMHALHTAGRALALPVVVAKDAPLIFRHWTPEVPMTAGIWDIPIPAGGAPVIPAILLIPMLGFDRQRYRLGYGGGFYDRTLADRTPRPLTIGISHAAAELPTVYPQKHDIALDIVLTEAGRF